MAMTEIFLFLFVVLIGITLGAGMYESRIVLPMWFNKNSNNRWLVNFENMKNIDSGRKFWGMVSTVPLTLVTMVNIFFAVKSNGQIHYWWLTATLIILIERLGTFTFFIPTAIKLQKGQTLVAEKQHSLISRWVNLNYVRNFLTFIAFVISLKALTYL